MAQEKPAELPPLEVTAKQSTKKKKAAPAKAAQPAPVSAPIEAAPATKTAPITVSGEPSIGTNTTEITSQDLERINPTDIKDVFSGQPGILVGSSIPMSQKVYVNGVEETNLAVTVDGAAQNNKVFHHNGTNLIDPSLLKAVRVDAGVAPADAGFGALAGSIAYETKDVGDLLDRDGFGGFAKTQFNTNGNVFTNNLASYGMSNGFEILGSFSFGDGDEFEAGNGETVKGTETNFLSGLGKLAYQAPTGDRFEISHERFNDDAIRPYRANAHIIGRPYEPATRPYELNRQSTVFNYSDATPQGWWDPKIVVAYSKSDVTVPLYESATDFYDVSGESDAWSGKAENKFNIGIGNVVAGVDFSKRNAKLFDVRYGNADEQSTVVGAYSQARIEPVTGTRLSFGGRADQQWFTGVNGREWEEGGLSGNISGEQDLLGRFLTAKAGYSHVWGGIPLAENFVMNPVWTYPGGPDAVVADNYTAGLVARYKGWTFEGSVFRTEIDNARVALWGEPNRSGVYGSVQAFDVETEGFEIGAGYEWRNGFLRVKYANIDATIDGKPADSYLGNYLVTPFGEMITVTGAHTFEGTGVTIRADALFAPEYDRVAAGYPPYPSYTVFNAFVEYQPDLRGYDLTFRLDVRNIFDETYAERASYGHEFVGEVTPLYEPGRSFLLSTTAKF
ncbi:TonB-dependent receptor domain-containing protein [Hyphomicrobium sp. LHD-15]|uniref:TonB-dependent receptor domain-containing protein n=1 Tax=Hyphomicrobium sp. LHD-15 TaxID=3072142 RepID=UPI00280F5767|nr:TonB-dependent receptor [Hyphomicrobium sp. LHD-15]MDQ8700524.1 TonB-dependent receptor plug domain-containing protein [Hyphomicrobium sp. LHD-15]